MTYRRLAAIHPKSDLTALLMMEDKELRETLHACRCIYGTSGTIVRVDPNSSGSDRVFGRSNMIAEILRYRSLHDSRTPEERAAAGVYLEDDA